MCYVCSVCAFASDFHIRKVRRSAWAAGPRVGAELGAEPAMAMAMAQQATCTRAPSFCRISFGMQLRWDLDGIDLEQIWEGLCHHPLGAPLEATGDLRRLQLLVPGLDGWSVWFDAGVGSPLFDPGGIPSGVEKPTARAAEFYVVRKPPDWGDEFHDSSSRN